MPCQSPASRSGVWYVHTQGHITRDLKQFSAFYNLQKHWARGSGELESHVGGSSCSSRAAEKVIGRRKKKVCLKGSGCDGVRVTALITPFLSV